MSERDKAIERGKAKAEKTGRQRSAKQDKKGKKGDAEAAGATSVATHPRAAAAVRRAKGIGGLVGFAIAALASRKAGITHEQMLERALLAGVVGYVLVWACAVAVWRHIVQAEMRATIERQLAARPVARTISLANQARSQAATAAEAPTAVTPVPRSGDRRPQTAAEGAPGVS